MCPPIFYLSKPTIIISSHYLHAGDIRGACKTLNIPHPLATDLCLAHVSIFLHVFFGCTDLCLAHVSIFLHVFFGSAALFYTFFCLAKEVSDCSLICLHHFLFWCGQHVLLFSKRSFQMFFDLPTLLFVVMLPRTFEIGYLKFFFCLKILFKVNGKATVWHTLFISQLELAVQKVEPSDDCPSNLGKKLKKFMNRRSSFLAKTHHKVTLIVQSKNVNNKLMNFHRILLKWRCKYICGEEILCSRYWTLYFEMKTLNFFYQIGAN